MIKALSKLDRGQLPQFSIEYPQKNYKNITHNSERVNALLLKSRIEWGCPLSPHLLNKVMEALASTIRKNIKSIQIEKQELKPLFADNVTVYIENPKESTKKKKIKP